MGEKGTQLNKCLCKAHVCGVFMVTVLSNLDRDNHPECLQSFQWYHNSSYNVVLMVVLLSCMCFTKQCADFANAELFNCMEQTTEIHNQIVNCMMMSFEKCLITFILK